MFESVGIYIGRFQPLHEGHVKCIEYILEKQDICTILVRDTRVNDKNPLTAQERIDLLRATFPDREKVRINVIADSDANLSIYFGREVGYELIQLDASTEKISGTSIRKKMYERKDHKYRIVWLTGNSGAGKTTLAESVKEDYPQVVVLDGDDMRSSISIEEGFSASDRRRHNLKVARLAKVFHDRGLPVIVSVIAPHKKTRADIDKVCDPAWVYIAREGLDAPDRPYEVPEYPDLILDHNNIGEIESSNRLKSFLREVWE